MAKSTIALVAAKNGTYGLSQDGKLFIKNIKTRKEARALLRQARAAERGANTFLKGGEANAE